MAPKSGSAELLAALRAAMAAQGLAALVVPSEGACVWMLHVWVWVWGWVLGVGLCVGMGKEQWAESKRLKKSRSVNTHTHAQMRTSRSTRPSATGAASM